MRGVYFCFSVAALSRSGMARSGVLLGVLCAAGVAPVALAAIQPTAHADGLHPGQGSATR